MESKVAFYGRFIMMLNFFCRSNYGLWAESNIGDVWVLLPSPQRGGCRRNSNGGAGASGSGCAGADKRPCEYGDNPVHWPNIYLGGVRFSSEGRLCKG